MAKKKFAGFRDRTWERGYFPRMKSVREKDGVVTNYKPHDLEILVPADHMPKNEWSIMQKLSNRRRQEAFSD